MYQGDVMRDLSNSYLVVTEAADLLRVKTATIYCWNHARKKNANGFVFPAQKAGKKLIFDANELRVWAQGGNPKTAA